MKADSLTPKSALGFGLLPPLGIIGYFLIMRAFGLIHHMELRYFNGVILLIGVLASMRHRAFNQPHFSYLEGFGQGVITGVVATLLFSGFISVYLRIDKAFLEYIQANAMFGSYLNSQTVFGVLVGEGFASTVCISFISMQYFKRYIVRLDN